MHLYLWTVPGNVLHIDPDGLSTLGIRPSATGGNLVSRILGHWTSAEMWILCQVTCDACGAFPHVEILIEVSMMVHEVEVQVELVRAFEGIPTASVRCPSDPEIGIARFGHQVRP